MGMFDELVCKYPLPLPEFQDALFQTKDLINQLEQYEIREDGSLWRQDYDIEDRSDPDAVGLDRLKGIMTQVNKRWVPVAYGGTINFYTWLQPGWVEFQGTFENGEMRKVELVVHRTE